MKKLIVLLLLVLVLLAGCTKKGASGASETSGNETTKLELETVTGDKEHEVTLIFEDEQTTKAEEPASGESGETEASTDGGSSSASGGSVRYDLPVIPLK